MQEDLVTASKMVEWSLAAGATPVGRLLRAYDGVWIQIQSGGNGHSSERIESCALVLFNSDYALTAYS